MRLIKATKHSMTLYRIKYQPFTLSIFGRSVNQDGFTLIEIISILLLVGIVSFVIVSRPGNNDIEVLGDSAVLKNHLRYAQIKAMNSDVSWGINFSGSSYALEDESSNQASLPGEMPSNISYSSTDDPVMFDQRGSPGDTTILITLSKGSSSATITVTRNTGFIP